MKRIILVCLFGLFTLLAFGQQKNLYDFKVKDIDGKEFDLSSLKGKKVMLVNVASKCGLTPQYEQLEALSKQYKNKNFVIIGFPSDNFAGQEFDTNSEIKQFCSLTYGVTFPMMSKIDVKGDHQSPVYRWLTRKSENGYSDNTVEWNFQKYLIDEKGNLSMVIPPRELPDSERIIRWIEE